MVGSGELFTPSLSVIKKHIDTGNIVLVNESSNNIVLKLSKLPRVRMNMDEVYNDFMLAGTMNRYFDISLLHDGKIITLGIKDWLDVTINMYRETYKQYKKDRINKLLFNIDVFKYLPEVAKFIQKNKTREYILANVKGLNEELLTEIENKSIKFLLKDDDNIEEIINKISVDMVNVEKEDPDVSIKTGSPYV